MQYVTGIFDTSGLTRRCGALVLGVQKTISQCLLLSVHGSAQAASHEDRLPTILEYRQRSASSVPLLVARAPGVPTARALRAPPAHTARCGDHRGAAIEMPRGANRKYSARLVSSAPRRVGRARRPVRRSSLGERPRVAPSASRTAARIAAARAAPTRRAASLHSAFRPLPLAAHAGRARRSVRRSPRSGGP